MLIFGLMLLLPTAACLDRFCSFDQSDPCYTALGDKLNLLMVNASKYDLKIQKRTNNPQDDPVCRVRNGTMKRSECDLYRNRPEVTVINGTLIINPVIRTDSGNYRLTVYNSDGSETSRDLQVIVEAPSVALIILGCFAVIIIVLVAAACCFYRKRIWPKPNASTCPRKNEKKETELHYGEVTFTDRKVRQRPSEAKEECLYAQVQTL
ncbi:si:zfos-741a10.3 [Puntigrus tetrazona]|uniref:si:zfos-741a10.3 n=1 Tax=Puntigrus tetrazona TaxID=1606681 RepID=UPI001C8928D9|nr:si:zfos-741a10.3 [Puntigrus tetrazona]